MLVLGRDFGERVVIRIPPSKKTRIIEVINCNHKTRARVKLGIEADRDIEVLRSELLDEETRNVSE